MFWVLIKLMILCGNLGFTQDDNSVLFQELESRANPLSLNRCELYMVRATRMKTKGHT